MERQEAAPGQHPRLQKGRILNLRVVSGTLGGRYIQAPPGRDTRPTGARVREAWFNALGDRVEGATALDLFAGSGALGIEALSRGAAGVQFVEEDRRAFEVLRGNIDLLGLSDRARLHRGEVFRFLDRLQAGRYFDLAFADPPYAGPQAERLVRRYHERPFADLLCLEHRAAGDWGRSPSWQRRYGDTTLTFFTAPKGGDTGGR